MVRGDHTLSRRQEDNMDFKFNFLSSEDLSCEKDSTQDDCSEEAPNAVEIHIDKEKHGKVELEQKSTETWEVGNMVFTLISSASLENDLKEDDISSAVKCAVQQHSDLIPGIYEGGLKIWEGAIDLCNYLASSNIDFSGKRVLELGCGAGIPGIFALKKGAVVHFQDFNKDVLQLLTIPNVLLNTSCDNSSPSGTGQFKFFSGDWKYILRLFENDLQQESYKYDIVLSSETIYNPANNKHLYSLIKSSLKKAGVVYIAAKSYYFGVGGGVEEFKQLVETDHEMDIQTCWCHLEGVKREVLRLQRKNS